MELQLIQSKIYEIRGCRVMLDRDLAELYQVETKNLNRAVKRNIERFPERFMFQLTKEEASRCQIGTSNGTRGGNIKYLPFAFTEQGVSMLSAVLRSNVAIQVSINIMDAFVAMRQYVTSVALQSAEIAELRQRIKALEHGSEENLEAINDLSQDIYKDIDNIYLAIGELSIKPAPAARRPIGFGQPWKDTQ